MNPAAEEERSDLAELLAPIRGNRGRATILIDVDGTIAPIVVDPKEAAVPERTRELLQELSRRYPLVGCLSGRRALDAKRVVGVDGLAYSGNHGYELLLPGEDQVRSDPSLDGHEQDAPRFVDGLDRTELDRAGIRTEDKGAIVALHWRGAPNEAEAESLAREIGSEAESQGLVTHRGRKVLEVRPNVAINKGIAVATLISAYATTTNSAARSIDAALYGGDDRTDLDAFAALRSLKANGALTTAVCIGVTSDESPPEVAREADAAVAGPGGFVTVLEALVAD